MLRSCFFASLVLWTTAWAYASSSAWIPVSAPWRYQRIASTAPDPGWVLPGFDDRSWPVGLAGFSVGRFGYEEAATLLPNVIGNEPVHGILLRHSWVVESPEAVELLTLRVDYEDGLVGWLNGVEVFRRGVAPGRPVTGLEVPAPRFSGEVEWMDLSPFRDRLIRGTNVLALLSLDAGAFSPTLFVWPELRANFVQGPLVQNVSFDAVDVCWKTAAPRAVWVEYRRDAEGEDWVRISPNGRTVDSVRLTGLQPDTRYRYRVGWDGPTGAVVSDVYTFTTFKGRGDVRFLVVGDTGTGSAAQYAVASAMAAEEADFVLHTGDIAYPYFVREQIELRCFGVYEPQMRRVPFYFTVGNHDFYRGDTAYLEAFHLPTNSVTGTEHYYSFDHGDVHCVSLFIPWVGVSQMPTVLPDGTRTAPYRWLTNDLARSSKPWKVVFFHQPLRTSGPHILDDYDVNGRGDVTEIQDALLPALAAHGVDVVFNGHDHGWERFAPTNGVHSVVSGGGGAVLYPAYRRDSGSTQFAMRHHYTRVHVTGSEMRIEAVAPSGEVFDTMALRHRGGGVEEARFHSRWRSLPVPPERAMNGDGNFVGETFELQGDGTLGVPGLSVNPGRLLVNHDSRHLHVGFRDLAFWPGQTLLLFVETPDVEGVSRCAGVGALRQHPLSSLNLDFLEFRPAWAFLLGDERADATSVEFQRAWDPVGLGQGVFRLNPALEPVAGARVRQFNRSPEAGVVVGEENADFIQVTVPREVLGAGRVGATVRMAAVMATPVSSPNGVRLALDTAYHGSDLQRVGPDSWVLKPMEFVLSAGSDSDRDGDALEEDREQALGTDPDHPDSDRDGLLDGWEVQYRLNPLKPEGADGAAGDVDGDGFTNLEEFRSGTDPRDPAPTLRASVRRMGAEVRLSWRSTVGRRYGIEMATQIPGTFEPVALGGFPRVAESAEEWVRLEPGWMAAGQRWFRIRDLGRP